MAMNRDFMELVAAAINVDTSTYANDSKLEQKLIYELKAMTAKAGTATTKVAPPVNAARISGGANI